MTKSTSKSELISQIQSQTGFSRSYISKVINGKGNNSQISLIAAKAQLKRGDIGKIANMSGYSNAHVSNVLKGTRKDKNGVILATALKVTKA